MKAKCSIWAAMICGMAGVLCVAYAFCAEPSAGSRNNLNGGNPAAPDAAVDEKDRVSLAVAKDRAQVMHDIYVATLDVMHHRFFRHDSAVVPARAMEDVFSEIQRQSKAEARWISVNTKAMSINHEPKSRFEMRAAEEIAAGKAKFELVEDGYYRRAGAIPLTDGCVSCHEGFFKATSKTPKFAGLVIGVPINGDSVKPD